MPSPLAHGAMGWLIYRIARACLDPDIASDQRAALLLLAATVSLSLLPHIDTALGVVAGDLMRSHNNVSHRLIFGLTAALALGGTAGIICRRSFGKWFLITLFA